MRFDKALRERLERALKGEPKLLPRGLTREQRRKFLRDSAKLLTDEVKND